MMFMMSRQVESEVANPAALWDGGIDLTQLKA